MDFRSYVKEKLLKKTDRILEFGPLIRPIATRKEFPNIFFADVRTTSEISKLYESNDYLDSTGLSVDIDQVVEIDYVISRTYKETFKNQKKFDVIYLSHVVEHIPSIIDFFQDISNILTKNGKLILIYPDARYCFDHFRNGTTFVDAYDVYLDKKNLSKRVLDFYYNVVNENDPTFFWNSKNQNNILPSTNFQKSLDVYQKSTKGLLPDDTHFWPFSDFQFIKFLYDLDRAGLFEFEIVDFHQTQINTQEFMIVLSLKQNDNIGTKYEQILNKIDPKHKELQLIDDIDNTKNEMYRLRAEYDRLNIELSKIYKSKEWNYVMKLSHIVHKFRSIL